MLGLSAINDQTRRLCPCCKLNKVSYISDYKYCVTCYDLFIQKEISNVKTTKKEH